MKENLYVFIFEDKQGNLLQRKEYSFLNIKEARNHVGKLLAESMLNDLFRIKIKRA